MERIKAILESGLSQQVKVDKLLQYDCELHTNLGTESKLEERQHVEKTSKKIIDKVVEIDPDLIYLK